MGDTLEVEAHAHRIVVFERRVITDAVLLRSAKHTIAGVEPDLRRPSPSLIVQLPCTVTPSAAAHTPFR
jgi:hypothetical protein